MSPPLALIVDPDLGGERLRLRLGGGEAEWARPLLEGPPTQPLWVGKRARFVAVEVEEAAAPVAAPGAGTAALVLSAAAARRLFLPPGEGLRVCLRRDPEGLRLGPVIGLLLGDGVSGDPPPLWWIERCLGPCVPVGLVYAFTLRDVDHARAAVRGRLWAAGRLLEPQLLPLPDAVWNREELPDRLRPLAKRLCDGRLFNERLAWSKAEVQAVLDGLPHVPPAVAVRLGRDAARDEAERAAETVAGFVTRHGAAYWKPVYGSKGAGVARLTVEEGELVAAFDTPRDVETAPSAAPADADGAAGMESTATAATEPPPTLRWRGRAAEILRRCSALAPSRAGYLVQAAVRPAVPDRPLDARLALQRDVSGAWRATALWGRIGAPGRITANLSTGAERLAPEALWALLGLDGAAGGRLLRDMEAGLADFAERLGARFGACADLGFDVTFDPDGRWWLIEVNPRHDLTLFRNTTPEVWRAVACTPLEYAATLAGFGGTAG
ncbi:MAG: YheC/YheD family protein [Firmicutes bacterium]|nr:YheC/YheD family protein [Bacillota bacterium]